MKDTTTKEAIDKLKHTFELHTLFFGDAGGGQLALEKVLNELEKKDKIIDAMIEWIENEQHNKIDDDNFYTSSNFMLTKEEIKQYFEQEVKNE